MTDQVFTWGVGRTQSITFSPDGLVAAAGSDTGKMAVRHACV